jgi:hypothetical protein
MEIKEEARKWEERVGPHVEAWVIDSIVNGEEELLPLGVLEEALKHSEHCLVCLSQFANCYFASCATWDELQIKIKKYKELGKITTIFNFDNP